MTDHEKLKRICDYIWYKTSRYDDELWFFSTDELEWTNRTINVREIIFTQTFMDKYKEKVVHRYAQPHFAHQLTITLDNPIKYLYNLIEWKE